MRNAFADLGRPAAPRALDAHAKLRTVTLRIRRLPDPRVRTYRVVRHRGAGLFSLDDQGVAQVCRTDRLVCTNRRVPRGTYRYAVVAEDEWGASVATFSRKVVVRKARR
jgi:hypothetical protein